MKILAKKKMPANIVAPIDDDGWPSIDFRDYAEEVAVKWGVHEVHTKDPYYIYSHTNYELLFPGKDGFIVHCVKEHCEKEHCDHNKKQRALCIRVTKSGKTIIIAEHDFGTCRRIKRF
jgi:hypothetical protein